jgi:hypothetical protein
MTSGRRAGGPVGRVVRPPRRRTPDPDPGTAAAGVPVASGTGADAYRRREREALADIRDALERDDPDLCRSFTVLAGPRVGRWLAGLAGCIVLTGATFWALGIRALGVVAVVLVLGAPVVVCLGCPGAADATAGLPEGGAPAPGS